MKTNYDKIIKNHYDLVAKKFRKSKLSTMNDEFVRNEETKFILKIINKTKSKSKILDIGCGNGYTLDQISRLKKKNFLYGLEYNRSLYKISQKRLKNKANISNGDVRIFFKNYKKKFDIIILQRVLINLLNSSHQKKSLKNILSYLKINGKLVVIECFDSGLIRLNKIRSKYGLKKIKPKYHNKYLSENFFKIKNLKKIFDYNDNLSKHFFNSRFLDPIFLKSKREKNFVFNSSFIRDLDNIITSLNNNYSHLQLLLFKKFN